MKLSNIYVNGHEQIGIQTTNGVLVCEESLLGSDFPTSVDDLLRLPKAMTRLKQWVEQQNVMNQVMPEEAVRFRPCVERPGKIICIGLNYRKHAVETNALIPTQPVVFSKFSDTVAAHKENIPLPMGSNQVDYEAELVMVIGRHADHVLEQDALDYVFGYCNANDLSARDLQFRTSQWLLGKTCPKFSPIGPLLVTTDEISNPNNLGIRTYRNGELVQNSNTSDMIFSCKELIQYVSQYIPLNPGDMILTGTPEGVILGLPESERRWLQPGDEVAVEIDGLGKLSNRMVER